LVKQGGRTQFSFELLADTPEDACEAVTGLFRSVYGLHWWADVSRLPAQSATLH
jgi:hypothetical protein